MIPGRGEGILLFKLLIDTCVWLDLARDYRQHTILAALGALVRQREAELILPRTVVEEFVRNKAHVIDESTRSLSSTMKRVKEAVEKFGDPRQRGVVLRQLNDVDHRLPLLGESAIGAIRQIEELFALTAIIEISDGVKLRAAQRGIDKRAPFHRQRNGIAGDPPPPGLEKGFEAAKKHIPYPANWPTQDELRMQEQANRNMERFWNTVLQGSIYGGAAYLGAPVLIRAAPAAIGAVWQWITGGGGGVLVPVGP